VGTVGIGDSIADVWGATVSLSAQETISTGRSNVSRTFENTFNIDVDFQRYATVSTSIDVFSAVQITSAIINEQFGTQVEGEGTITFITQIGYPYQLLLNNAGGPMDTVETTYPMSATTLTTSGTANPATTSGTYTTQTFLLSITPGSGTCILNGIYATTSGRFTIQCTQAAVNNGQCPQITNSGAGISLNISSSSFCGQVLANVSAVLSINSYADSGFTTPTTNFLVQPSGVAYFEVAVQSSPEVAVTGLTVSRVQIYSVHLGGTQTLYTNGLTTTGQTFSFSLISSPGITTAFSFGVVSAFNVPRDTLDSVAVTALIEVEYQSVNKKRTILVHLQYDSSTTSTPSHVTTSLQLTGSDSSVAPPSLHSSLVVTAIAMLVSCFMIV